MTDIIYFAYGSNMLTERLRARCRSTQVIGAAWAEGYQLQFNKKSADGSSKGNLMRDLSGQCRAHGVLFVIASDDLDNLHECEGYPGHYRYVDEFNVILKEGKQVVRATTYLAEKSKIVTDKLPYDWYLGLVVAGAIQHGFPEKYVAVLKNQMNRPDPMPERRSGVEARKLLERVKT